MAHPVGNIADQISRCLLQRYLSSVFQHNQTQTTWGYLYLFFSLESKQTGTPTLKHKQMVGLQDRGIVPSLFRGN